MRGSGALYGWNLVVKRRNIVTQFYDPYLSVILKIVGGEYRAFSSAFLRSLEVSGVYDWYDACATSGENKKEEEMTKSKSIFCMSLLAATLIAPTARGFADDDDRHDSRNQRQDLRQDQQQLEQLRQQRDREIREGDKRETREYNSKIRNLEKDMRRDRKDLNKDEREERGNKDHDHE